MEPLIVQQMTTRIFELLEEKLGAKGKTLQKRLAYVNRKLPARVKRAGEALIDAQALAGNPRMAMQIDGEAFSAAYDEISTHLSQIDSAAERSRKRYNMMAAIAAQVLLFGTVVVAFLMWRGVL